MRQELCARGRFTWFIRKIDPGRERSLAPSVINATWKYAWNEPQGKLSKEETLSKSRQERKRTGVLWNRT